MNKKIACLILLAAGVPLAAVAQFQKIGIEQLPANLGNVVADLVTAPKIRAYNSAGNEHLLYIGSDSGNSTEGFRFRFDSSSGQAFVYVRNSLRWQFDSGNMFLRDPLDFFDGDDLRWNYDDASLGYNSSSNVFRFEDASDASMVTLDMDDGSLDAQGHSEFGSASSTLSIFQPAAEAISDSSSAGTPEVLFFSTGNDLSPRLAGIDSHVVFGCPWATSGTRLKSLKAFFYFETASDKANFSVSRRSTTAPQTEVSLLNYAGSDYNKSNSTQVSGNYYTVSSNLNTTLSGSNQAWATVRLYASSNPRDCRLCGIEWVFEQRRY